MDSHPRRRLRSATVQLGALTVLALALSGCDLTSDDDDDCAMGPATSPPGRSAARVPQYGDSAAAPGTGSTLAALPESGGFGTYLASCGG